jgi:hypothetical protein
VALLAVPLERLALPLLSLSSTSVRSCRRYSTRVRERYLAVGKSVLAVALERVVTVVLESTCLLWSVSTGYPDSALSPLKKGGTGVRRSSLSGGTVCSLTLVLVPVYSGECSTCETGVVLCFGCVLVLVVG